MLSPRKQLEHFFSLEGIAELLKYRENRPRHEDGTIEDIFDALVYLDLQGENNSLTESNDYTYVLNTDGVKIRKGAKLEFYPLFVRLNELPPHLRQKFVFLAGIYCDSKPPNMSSLLIPLVEQLNRLADQGITWRPNGGEEIRSRFYPTCFCVDAKARAQMLEMVPHNSHFGCSMCCHPGVWEGGSMRYPIRPHPEIPMYEDRTDQGMIQDMLEVHRLRQQGGDLDTLNVRGHKRPSALMNARKIKLATGQAVDDLHYFYECTFKNHLDLLLKTPRIRVVRRMGYEALCRRIDDRLRKIVTPGNVSRKPGMTTMKNRGSMKGTELKNLLMFYLVPCLDGLIKVEHIKHVELLSHAVFLLSKDAISEEDINNAEANIKRYLELYEEYWSLAMCMPNMHNMSHAGKSVRQNGGFWVYSTFNFESWNNRIIKTVTSPKGAMLQVVTRHLIHMSLEVAQLDHNDNLSLEIRQELRHILGRSRFKFAEQVSPHVHVLGRPNTRAPTDEERHLLESEGFRTDRVNVYKKAILRSTRYNSTEFGSRSSKTDNTKVFTWQKSFCTINRIVTFPLQGIQGAKVCGMFVLKHHLQQRPFQHARHIAVLMPNDGGVRCFIKEEAVHSPVVTVPVLGKVYVIPLPNQYEVD